LAEEFAKTKKGGQAITTLMIRNIPNRCSQRELIGELERVGFAGCFDFVYVPLDLGTMSNVGYAFVNFIHPTYASRCMEMLPKHQFSRQRKSGKPVAVSPAHMQGLEANLRHYEKSAVNTSRLRQRRPVVMNILKTVSLASLI
jgi:RNA recognition motif-containing protein